MRYFEENSDAKEISLPNVTSTELFGLYCDVEYQVEVRACLHGNKSCSPYSKSAEIMKARSELRKWLFTSYLQIVPNLERPVACILVNSVSHFLKPEYL